MVYVLVVVFGRIIYQYQKRNAAMTNVNSADTAVTAVTGEILLLFMQQ